MILLPIGRDETEIQRHAWISYGIIAANVLAFIIVGIIEHSARMSQIDATFNAAIRYIAEHPYLEIPANLAAILPDNVENQLKSNQPPYLPPTETITAQQEELNELADAAVEAWHDVPSIRYAYIPTERQLLTLFTSMFLHAGFMHLFGNMLFFYLSGPFIEDVFGRPLFALLYFFGGIAATLTYASRNAQSTIPLLGASGAIAAVMGAYLVRFATSKVEFIFIPFLLRPTFHFRFFLPAFVVLPLWFAEQVWDMSIESNGPGVAFSAHVGGFLFGLVFACVIKVTNIEEKFIKPVIEKQTTWKADDRLTHVIENRHAARYSDLKQLIDAVLRDDPQNVDALRLGIDIAHDNSDLAAVDTYATRLFGRYSELKQQDVALELVEELASDRQGPPLPKFFARAAASFERAGDRDWALYLYERIVAADPNSTGTINALMKVGALLRAKGDVAGAKKALTQARAHPACTAEWVPSIDAKLAQLGR
ncbi:MAG TPA: rhomboid family intramembrane serine protease [Thermoanaerobaculia bacterium]|nr:rhomboid family intramembrane serine protease [Thermoanaerobaculia bacterium]